MAADELFLPEYTEMEIFSALLAIFAGNSSVPGEFPALMFSLICVWIIGWLNSREAGDLRRYHSHYDVIVMSASAVMVLT